MLVQDDILINLNTQDSSANAINGTMLSYMNFQLKGILKQEDTIVYSRIGILNAQLPVSFYQITSSNNRLDYLWGVSPFTLYITEGNYNAYSFMTEAVARFLANGHTVQISQSTTTGKLTVATASTNFSFLSTSTATAAFGFSSTVASVSFTATMPYQCNILGVKRIRVSSNALPIGSPDGSLATIPVDSTACVMYNNMVSLTHILRTQTIGNIDIHLQDESGNYLDMGGAPWTMTLLLSVMRYSAPKMDPPSQIEFSTST